jgi:hypothetical protein
MLDAWEVAYNLAPHSPDDASLDPDLDGASNLAEYRAGTDPRNPASVLKLTVVGQTMDRLELQFAAVAERHYELQFSHPQSPGSWQQVALLGPFADSGLEQIEVDIGDGSAGHFRLFMPGIP